jgi:hypothetical protein
MEEKNVLDPHTKWLAASRPLEDRILDLLDTAKSDIQLIESRV